MLHSIYFCGFKKKCNPLTYFRCTGSATVTTYSYLKCNGNVTSFYKKYDNFVNGVTVTLPTSAPRDIPVLT